jgi:hypothetical protein
MLHTSTKSRSCRARMLAADRLQIARRRHTMAKCFHVLPNRRPLSDRPAIKPVMHKDSNQRPSLSSNKIIGIGHLGLQKCKTPRVPVLPALEGLTSETDALAEFMSRPASSL